MTTTVTRSRRTAKPKRPMMIHELRMIALKSFGTCDKLSPKAPVTESVIGDLVAIELPKTIVEGEAEGENIIVDATLEPVADSVFCAKLEVTEPVGKTIVEGPIPPV